jgi:hypothetical protein
MFDTTKEDLKDILRKAHEGRLQLPDFQRDYVWGDEDVRSLIASIAKGFPVGALLTLESGGEVHFKPRLLAGVPPIDVAPVELLLDGQQRITSLYQVAYSQTPVKTKSPKGAEIERYYYLDIKLALSASASIDDAIVGVPADRVVRENFGRDIKLDLSTRQYEFEQDYFPLNQVFNNGGRDWFYDWRDHWRAKGRDVSDLDRSFVRTVIDRIERYKMPIICLDRDNSREGICIVFEKVNVGGKKLDAFELVTAIYASDNFDLREDWSGTARPTVPGRRARMIGTPNRRDVLTQVARTDFLQACTLLHTRENRLGREAEGKAGKELPQISCKRDALLDLPLAAYRKHASGVESGFVEAGAFLNEQKIIWNRDVPYPPLIVGLASAFAILGKTAQTAAAKQKVAQWFWCVTLGELYGSSTESRLAKDVPQLVNWVRDDGAKPQSLDEALFQQDRLKSLRSRLSAAYKGLHALLMRHGCRDFITGRGVELMTFFNDKIDIHHIFPKKWCISQGIKPAVFNSIVNKSPLFKRSNITISGSAPSAYLMKIEQEQGISASDLDDILRTHLIDPKHLRNDDFDAFMAARTTALTELIADAMGKPVVQEHGTNESEGGLELDDAGDDDEDEVESSIEEAA